MSAAAAAAASIDDDDVVVECTGKVPVKWHLKVPDLKTSLLHVLLMEPLSLLEYLLPRRRWVSGVARDVANDVCIVDYLRDNMVVPGVPDIVSATLFERIEIMLRCQKPHHIVWLFIAAMAVDAGLYTAVASTFPGPPETFEQICAYLFNKLLELQQAPYYPSTSGRIMQGMWMEVRLAVCYNDIRTIERESAPKVEKTSCPRSGGSGNGRGNNSTIQRKRREAEKRLELRQAVATPSLSQATRIEAAIDLLDLGTSGGGGGGDDDDNNNIDA